MPHQSQSALQILRRKQVEARTGLCRSAIYALIAKGEFPRPTKLTARAVGWPASAIDTWITQKVEAQ